MRLHQLSRLLHTLKMIPKLVITLLFIFLIFNQLWAKTTQQPTVQTVPTQQLQRLVLPLSSSSSLKLTPKVEVPMPMTSSVLSGFKFELPIKMRFPSMRDFVSPLGTVMNVANAMNAATMAFGTNGSGFGPGITIFTNRSSKARINSRARFYKSIERTRIGETCLLRAICEVSEIPFMAPSTGLIGEVIDLLLRTTHLFDDFGVLKKYRKAEQIGLESSKSSLNRCKDVYKDCPLSLFNVMNIPIS